MMWTGEFKACSALSKRAETVAGSETSPWRVTAAPGNEELI